jgi:hypothetical protein
VARTGYNEFNQRALLSRWADHLDRAGIGASQVAAGEAAR